MERKSVLNIEQLITGLPNQLRYIKRFSNSRAIITENVTEHTFYVVIICLFIAEHLELEVEDKYELLKRAIIHDMEELFTGDIIRPIKHADNNTKNAIHKLGGDYLKKLLNDIIPKKSGELFLSWDKAKSGFLGRILKFSDYLSAIGYVYEEAFSGNILILRSTNDLLEMINLFKTDEYDFIIDLVWEVDKLLSKLIKLKENSQCLQK